MKTYKQIILQGLKIHKFHASFRRGLITLYFHSVPDHVVWTMKVGIVSEVAAYKVLKYLAEQNRPIAELLQNNKAQQNSWFDSERYLGRQTGSKGR